VIAGEAAEGARRLVDQHDRQRGGDVVRQLIHDETGGAPRDRVPQIAVAVVLAVDGEERRADAERPGVDGHPAHRDPQVAAHEGAL
jgi:hypothetical protein